MYVCMYIYIHTCLIVSMQTGLVCSTQVYNFITTVTTTTTTTTTTNNNNNDKHNANTYTHINN